MFQGLKPCRNDPVSETKPVEHISVPELDRTFSQNCKNRKNHKSFNPSWFQTMIDMVAYFRIFRLYIKTFLRFPPYLSSTFYHKFEILILTHRNTHKSSAVRSVLTDSDDRNGGNISADLSPNWVMFRTIMDSGEFRLG